MKNSGDYSLQDEAELLVWASKVARVDRRELTAWALSTINAEPNSRAEKQRRYQLAEVFLAAFRRQLEKVPDDAGLQGLIGKLEGILAEGSGQLDTRLARCGSLES
jgi:hypothetical protein